MHSYCCGWKRAGSAGAARANSSYDIPGRSTSRIPTITSCATLYSSTCPADGTSPHRNVREMSIM